MRAILVSILLGMIFAPAASATTGNELKLWMAEYERLNANSPGANPFLAGVYAGYLDGVSEINLGWCTPSGVTKGQIGDVVAKYLKTHPEKLHQEGALLIAGALLEAFPCNK